MNAKTIPAGPVAAALLPKPEMSHTESSWHQHVASMRAMDAAKKQGGDPSTMEALADAAGGPEMIAGVKLLPCTQGTILAMQIAGDLMEPYFEAEGLDPDEAELIQAGIAALIFRDQLLAYRELKTNGLRRIYTAAQELVWAMSLEESLPLTKHVNDQLAIFNQLNGGGSDVPEPGKPTGSGALSDAVNPQPETPSPASTGLCQTTTLPSTMPSGSSPSPQPSPSSPPETNVKAETPGQTTPPVKDSMPGTAPSNS